jgi:hypothetical protein
MKTGAQLSLTLAVPASMDKAKKVVVRRGKVD